MRGGWRIFLQLNNCCVFHYSIIDEYRSLSSLPPVSQDHVELTKRITYISRIHMHTKAATAFVTFKNLCNIILNSLPVSNSSCKRPKKTAKQMQMHKVNEFERNAANKNYIFRKKIEFVSLWDMKWKHLSVYFQFHIAIILPACLAICEIILDRKAATKCFKKL